MRSFKAKALLLSGMLLPGIALPADNAPVPPSLQAVPAARTDLAAAQPFAQDAASVGNVLAIDQLEEYRGGTEVSNSSVASGVVQDATAVNVATGMNMITGGAFAHASGLPVVIMNSGANVLIQNSTIVNVQFK